ncbi:hypothetical protein LSCM1_04226 [Leishmania martiniquensis]|uniref:RRM domain-containing protein n=1 Tax=Leishmania martiniquensis TaxID=1580590 RepID=A0A836KSE5_9TRYP|nr:hypothetical protein LSCM1_04226 [Leishmania martiniquensis]
MPASAPLSKGSSPPQANTAAAKRRAPVAGKSKSMSALTSLKDPVIYHGSVLLTNLPVNFKKVYSHTVCRFFSSAQQKHITDVRLIEEVGNATLCVEVDSKATAQLFFRQLQNRKVYGRRWKVQYVPTAATECCSEACLVDCFLIPPAPKHMAERALSGIPGFLSFIDTPDEPLPAGVLDASPIQDVDSDSEAEGNENGEPGRHQGQQRYRLLASFADEGSALHARAVLSGRLVGTSGVRMFLECRRGGGAAP